MNIVNSLENIVLDCIRNKLCYLSDNLINNTLKLPIPIGEKIFNYCCNDNRPIYKNELKFFNKDRIELSYIIIDKKKFIDLNNFEFLKGHKLKSLILINFHLINEIQLNPTIEYIKFQNCSFNCNFYYDFGQFLFKCHHLNTFCLSHADNMTDKDFIDICKGLRTCSNVLKVLDFSYCNLSETQSFSLADLLKNCTGLNEILLKKNKRIVKGFEQILIGLSLSSSTLSLIEFSECNLQYEDGLKLAELLEKCTFLKKVYLRNNIYLGDGFEKMCNGLRSSSSTLLKLDFTECYFSEQQGLWLGDLLKDCPLLTDINLSFNICFDKAFKKISQELKCSSSQLRKINFSNCCLTEQQAFWVGNLLKNCKCLEDVNLSYNVDMENGFKYICDGLKSSSSTLLKLDLRSCFFSQDQGLWLGNTLSACICLQEVRLAENTRFDNSFEKICLGLLSSSKTLKSLDFGECYMFEHQGVWLSNLLNECTELKELIMKSNENCENEFGKIFENLKSSSIECLNFAECNLSEETGISQLKGLLKNCKNLREIDLSLNIYFGKGFDIIFSDLNNSNFSDCTNIDVTGCNITDEQGYYIGNALKNCSLLREINMSSNKRLGRGFKFICEGLKSSALTLLGINFSKCNLTEFQCNWLSDLIDKCSFIHYINLKDNRRLRNGFKSLCSSLMSQSSSLKKINFSMCNLSEENGIWLGNLLRICTRLQEINVYGSSFEEQFVHVCNGVISSSSSLLKLDFSEANLSEQNSCIFASMLEHCTALEEIHFIGNENCGLAFEKICLALKSSSSSLLTLNFLGCNLSDNQGIWLNELLTECKAIQEVINE